MNSCFGGLSGQPGIKNFNCNNEDKLIECDGKNTVNSCNQFAGVTCSKLKHSKCYMYCNNYADSSALLELALGITQEETTTCQTNTLSECSCPTTQELTFSDNTPTTQEPPTCPPGPSEDIPTSQDTSTGDTHHNNSTDPSTDPNSTTPPSTPLTTVSPASSEYSSGTENTTLPSTSQEKPLSSSEPRQEQTDSCTSLGAALGGVAAVLAVILVGVVLGWVWHCQRNKGRAKFRER